ncbi:hypothetical protein [Phascolarctobacterium faecium]|uniref:hypothetical protein n=1 Tax=Phascolarctobacterium faecium TaxID=33025 RepID=UPI003522885E
MEIPKFIKGVAKYFTYASDSGETTPTTQADLQELMKNNNTILECLVDGLWQPDKEMQLGQIVRSPNMPANTVAKVTSVGVTGTTEPEWPETVEATVSDGSVTFTMVTNIINSYTKTEIDAKMEDKADLLDGKVPTDQLPEMDYVPKTGDTTIKGKLSVESPAEDSNNNEVATTSWVKTLIEKYIIDNILSICGVTYLLEQNGYVRIGILRNFTVQWGKSTGQTTNFPIAFTVSALKGFTQYNETGSATGNADQTVTSLSKTSITTYRGYGYNYWVIGY